MTTTPRKVVHHYVDHANDVDSPIMENAPINHSAASSAFVHTSDRTFPVTLHFMLNELKSDGLEHVVSWQPHGRCFVVHKQTQFVETILSMWFRQSKFASFQRQLNLYGFKRLTSGRDKGGYYHELFLRGKPLLAHKIPRTKVKNDGARKSTSPETEPNFYALPYLHDDEPNPTNRTLNGETETTLAVNSASSSTHAALPDSLPSYRNGNEGSDVESLARLAQQANLLRMNTNLDQLRNLNFYSRFLPSISSTNVTSDTDLLTRLLYSETLNNVKSSASAVQQPYTASAAPALTPLQLLFGQYQASLPPVANSALSSSPSILETARVALLQQQLRQLQQQNQQQLSSNFENSNDILASRLAVANGYTSVDQLLRDAAVGRNAANGSSGICSQNNSGTTTNDKRNTESDTMLQNPSGR